MEHDLEKELKRIDDFFDNLTIEEFEEMAIECGLAKRIRRKKPGETMKINVNGTEYHVKYKTDKYGKRSLIIQQSRTTEELERMKAKEAEHEGCYTWDGIRY